MKILTVFAAKLKFYADINVKLQCLIFLL